MWKVAPGTLPLTVNNYITVDVINPVHKLLSFGL